jgi:broad specificity phosphatase PhoE
MRLYISRHGESEANVQQIYSNGLGVHGLTETGRQQAAELADSLRGTPFAALYCSPVLRAVETAAIVAEALGLTYQTEDGLREYDVGVLEGRTYDQETDRIYWEVTRQWMVEMNWDAKMEGGESCNDIAARFMPFIRRLEGQYGQTDANVLLISHGGTLRCMLPLLLSNVDHAYALTASFGYASCIVAERRGGEWICLRWRDEVFEVT